MFLRARREKPSVLGADSSVVLLPVSDNILLHAKDLTVIAHDAADADHELVPVTVIHAIPAAELMQESALKLPGRRRLFLPLVRLDRGQPVRLELREGLFDGQVELGERLLLLR